MAPPDWCEENPNCHGWLDNGAIPNTNIQSHLDPAQGRWFFRLTSVTTVYRWGLKSHPDAVGPSWRINLPVGNPPSFPLAPGMNETESKAEAKGDLDIAGLVTPANQGGIGLGPRRRTYWVEWISAAHEMAHRDDYYPEFWKPKMDEFEVMLESSSVVYDCVNTPTGGAAAATLQDGWGSHLVGRHNAAIDE